MHFANATDAATDSGRDRPEIEITPAMVEAGVDALAGSGAFEERSVTRGEFSALATELYRAMASVPRDAKTPALSKTW